MTTCVSPWYNRTGWLGVKHQVTYLITYWTQDLSVSLSLSLIIILLLLNVSNNNSNKKAFIHLDPIGYDGVLIDWKNVARVIHPQGMFSF